MLPSILSILFILSNRKARSVEENLVLPPGQPRGRDTGDDPTLEDDVQHQRRHAGDHRRHRDPALLIVALPQDRQSGRQRQMVPTPDASHYIQWSALH